MLINQQKQRYAFHINTNNANYNNRIQNNRSMIPTNLRATTNQNGSPRWINQGRRNSASEQMGQRMRMMRSKITNLSIQQKNLMNQNNLYPSQLIFVLSNQQNNVTHIKKLIQNQKKRVDRDFDNFIHSIIHIIQDLKSSIYSQLNTIFINFIQLYRNMKDQVIKMKQNRKNIIDNLSKFQSDLKSPAKTQIINNNPNISNLNILQEISRDQDYYRHHRMYQEISNAYYQSIGPILHDVQNILIIGSQIQFYNDDHCKKILDQIHNHFYQDMKQIYDKKLTTLVTQIKNLLQDNNMLLKALNIQSDKFDQNNRNCQTPKHQKINQINIISEQNKKKKILLQSNPYGLQQSINKSKYNDQSNNYKLYNIRPTSNSVDNYKIKSKNNYQFLSPNNKQIQQIKKKSNANHTQFKTTKDQQNVILQWIESPSLIKKQTSIIKNSQNILLCLLFINDGKHIAIGSKDCNIYIHEVFSGRHIQTLLGHQGSICSLFNFGTFFASGGDSGCGSLILWQSQQFRIKKKIALHSAALTCIVDLVDGSHLATGGYDKKIHIYNYKTYQRAFQLNSCRSGVTSMVVCEQSRKLVSSSLDSTLSIWNICITNRELETIALQKIITNCGFVCSLRSLSLQPDMILIGNKQGKIMMVNIYSGDIIKTMTVGRGSVLEMAIMERRNKALHPIIISCCNGERESLFTRLDTGYSQSSKVRNNVCLGCGIGPKLVINNLGIVAIVNQTIHQKQIDFYEISVK